MINIGIIGCGVISDIYIKNLKENQYVNIVACADLYVDVAIEKAKQHNIDKGCSVKEILNDKSIDLILNLTIPSAHAKVSLDILDSGKHVYSEKPLSTSYAAGKKIIDKAQKEKLRVGCAPDTFLGGRLQTIRSVIDRGDIGLPLAATAFMTCHGHETWHPNPEFYYKYGGGPLFDMGPYYLTALVSLFGPIESVFGSYRKSFKQRTITSLPKKGEIIDVEVPTHVSGLLNFKDGLCATIITSFDVWDSHLPRIEIYGSDGTISINDADPLAGPNLFGGNFELRKKKNSDWSGFPETLPRKTKSSPWEILESLYGYNDDSRGVGVIDMINSIIKNKQHKASGKMALHVLEAMEGLYVSAKDGALYFMESTCQKPAPF